MAVMSAGMRSVTTPTTVDFYQRIFRPNETPEHYANVGRVGTVVWGLVVTFLALFAGVFGPLAIGYLRISSFVSGPILGIFLLGALTKRTTARGSLLGAAAGMIVIAAVALGTQWSFLYLGVIGVLATVAVGYVVSFFMEPPRLQGRAFGPSSSRAIGFQWNFMTPILSRTIVKRSANALQISTSERMKLDEIRNQAS